jgi:hypothetical protein
MCRKASPRMGRGASSGGLSCRLSWAVAALAYFDRPQNDSYECYFRTVADLLTNHFGYFVGS